MQKTLFHFFGKFFSRFSLMQKFLLISLIFSIAIIVAISWMVKMQNEAINSVRHEITGNRYERYVRSIYGNIALHRKALNYYLSGKLPDRAFLNQHEEAINSTFEKLLQFDQATRQDLQTKPSDFEKFEMQNLNPEELQRRWNQFIQNQTNLPTEEINNTHLDLLEDLQSLVLYITETSFLLQDPSIQNYYLIHTLYWLLTENLRTIPVINIEVENYLSQKTTNPKKAEAHLKKIQEWLTIFKLHLSETKDNIKKIILYEKNNQSFSEIETKLQGPYESLLKAFEKYSNIIEKLISVEGSPALLDEYFNDIKNVYNENNTLSNIISEILEKILEKRLEKLKREQFLALATTLLIALLAFALGIILMKSIIDPLVQVTKSAKNLGEGDLSVRVPVVYQDEVGNVAQAFNKMADSLQDLLKQLHWAGIQLTTSTTEIAATAKQQEITVVEQETTTKQIAATAKEISATTKDFAKTMKGISDAAEKTSSLATSGKEGLNQMELTMRQMVDAASNIAAKLAVLNEKASTITSVVTTISKVADQTNLLSLNAAIEAEKAGEHGRSFAVIAREIRRLADQTANATLDIEKMINEMLSAVSAGVMGVDKFSNEINSGVTQVTVAGEQLSKIIEQVQQLSSNFESVNDGMQAQFIGATQINESIVQLSETAQQTSESIRLFHKAIEQLNNAAIELQSMVTQIKK